MNDDQNERNLFGPARLGDLHLANRIVMAPMTRTRASDSGVATHGPYNKPDPATFYGEGAHGYTDYPALAASTA